MDNRQPETTITEIEWTRTSGRTHLVTIERSHDGYPSSWNRAYEGGVLVRAWPGDAGFRGNKFYDCHFGILS